MTQEELKTESVEKDFNPRDCPEGTLFVGRFGIGRVDGWKGDELAIVCGWDSFDIDAIDLKNPAKTDRKKNTGGTVFVIGEQVEISRGDKADTLTIIEPPEVSAVSDVIEDPIKLDINKGPEPSNEDLKELSNDLTPSGNNELDVLYGAYFKGAHPKIKELWETAKYLTAISDNAGEPGVYLMAAIQAAHLNNRPTFAAASRIRDIISVWYGADLPDGKVTDLSELLGRGLDK